MRCIPALVVCLSFVPSGFSAETELVQPFESVRNPPPQGPLDQIVFERQDQSGIQRANLCSDAVFVRRAYLDTIGTLPTAEETRRFLRDPRPIRRHALIDELLQREEFADYWAMKWSDLLRVKSEFPINLWPNAVQTYHRWIRTSIRENMPYDQFARELLTTSGSNFRAAQVNFYRAMESQDPQPIAGAVALAFLGQQVDQWPEPRLEGMAGFFAHLGYKSTAEWKEEIVSFDPFKKGPDGAPLLPARAVLPDDTAVELTKDRDPRAVFAEWLTSPDNPWFAKVAVNRAWYWLMGRGIVHEPDDFRPDNPPSNPELLAYLEQELIDSGYDLKHIYRLILNSTTYQLSSISQCDKPEAAALFAYYPARRLDAEVLADALCQVTGTTEEYSSLIPEPFTFIPADERSIALADGSITSSFLELFGRPPRDTGLLSERNNRPTASQRLHLLNSSHVKDKINQLFRSPEMARRRGRPMEMAEELYLRILSRQPTLQELETVRQYAENDGVAAWEAPVDLAWALINSAEFQYRH